MNSELEAYLAAARTAPVRPPPDTPARQREQQSFPQRFLETVDRLIKPVLDSAAATLQKHGYGATVELVPELSGSDPNTFPYITLHFSPDRCSASDWGYIYTLAGASVTFICRRAALCVEVVAAHPAAQGHERRVSFSTLALNELSAELVSAIVTDTVKQIIRV